MIAFQSGFGGAWAVHLEQGFRAQLEVIRRPAATQNRLGESPVSFECKVTQIIQLQRADKELVPSWLVLGEVVAVHIAKWLLKDGVYDTAAAEPILRGGGPADYFQLGPEALFKMYRPGATKP